MTDILEFNCYCLFRWKVPPKDMLILDGGWQRGVGDRDRSLNSGLSTFIAESFLIRPTTVYIMLINRPGVAGAVLQTPLSLIN